MTHSDPYLKDLYQRLYDTPTQQKFRALRPMPVGVVFIQWPSMGWDEMRSHLRLMKQLGYTCLKGIMLLPGTDERQFMHMALDEGIIPWWYDDAGWEEPTPELLMKLGIPADTPIEKLREDPRWLAHQDQVMRSRIDRSNDDLIGRRKHSSELDGGSAAKKRWRYQAGPELKSRSVRLDPEAASEFTAWLKQKYGTLAALKDAWNTHYPGLNGSEWQTWEEAVAWMQTGNIDREYNRYKDIIRWKTSVFLNQVRERVDAELEHTPDAPVRAGGEISVFLPVAGRGVDMEGIARLMAERGSLYPSTHPAWHFDTVHYELARTVFIYSSLMVDVFKGGWSATWESTGGPQQISGYKGWSEEANRALPAYTVDAGVMTQFMLTYLAAGYKGFGFWCWNHRPAGMEGGEYSLLDRNNQPGERAVRVGQIGQAARRWRDELWQAQKEPLVGVLFDQENDLHYSVMANFGRDLFVDMPVQARVGAGRALINANIPWEYVTADNLRKGLAARYSVIYLPAIMALSSHVFAILADYVKNGGRLVMDMPGGYFDEKARVTNTGKGSLFEQVFGCTLDDYQYSSNVPRAIDGLPLKGFVADLTPTTCQVLQRFDYGQPPGTPAIIENRFGKGAAVILGYEAALMCARPGNQTAEAVLVRSLIGALRPPFSCDGALVYRLCAPAADHYFVLNDGPARTVALSIHDRQHLTIEDAIDGVKLPAANPLAIDLPDYSGRWIRLSQ
jgi:beta-galactosidase